MQTIQKKARVSLMDRKVSHARRLRHFHLRFNSIANSIDDFFLIKKTHTLLLSILY